MLDIETDNSIIDQSYGYFENFFQTQTVHLNFDQKLWLLWEHYQNMFEPGNKFSQTEIVCMCVAN